MRSTMGERYRGLWRSLVSDLAEVTLREVKRRIDSSGGFEPERDRWKECLGQWVERAGPCLVHWLPKEDNPARGAVGRFADQVRVAHTLPLESALHLLTSYSLFRLRPYRR